MFTSCCAAGRSRSRSFSRSRSPRPRGRARSRYVSVFLKQYSTNMHCGTIFIKSWHAYTAGHTHLPRKDGMTTLLHQEQRKSTEGRLGRVRNTMGISGDHAPLMTKVIGAVQPMVMMSKLSVCFYLYISYTLDLMYVSIFALH